MVSGSTLGLRATQLRQRRVWLAYSSLPDGGAALASPDENLCLFFECLLMVAKNGLPSPIVIVGAQMGVHV